MVIIIDCGSVSVPDIVREVRRFRSKMMMVGLQEFEADQMPDHDALIISGTNMNFTDGEFEALREKFAFLMTSDMPTLGIGGGMQIIGQSYRAQIYKGVCERDYTTMTRHTDHAILSHFSYQFDMKTNHCEGITLPAGFQKVASSRNYEVEAIAHHFRPIYGVMFNPELSGTLGTAIFKNFFNLANSYIQNPMLR
ncbi:glutamine amidotransferase-related protein [Persicobacter psychrovividus]|uniref:Glutamine amidotransferase domain-containing protein n=1 Tax=Persicobacter psychrovividus TaxID=387638 RepID=A0ABM7VKJ2_9BACT|nr:hypothetical protein PEPS_37810 [Persicobacter psychrovividus]